MAKRHTEPELGPVEEASQRVDPGVLPDVDGRQSEAAAAIQRGVVRLLRAHGFSSLYEVPLANGRRADVVGLGQKSEIWIIEIKSSVEDFRADTKWPEYRQYCDRLFFAVDPAFPVRILPEDTGLIIADRYAGELIRRGPLDPLAAARRKAMMLSFARQSANRLMALIDPGLHQVINSSGAA